MPIRAALLLAALSPGSALAQDAGPVWELWSRPDSPVVIDVPDGLFDVRAKTPERDRIAWETASGDIALTAWALPPGASAGTEALADAQLALYPDRTVTYRTGGDTWTVISGYEDPAGATIFYERFEVEPDGRFAAFSLIWAEARRPDVDDLVGRIGNSLALR